MTLAGLNQETAALQERVERFHAVRQAILNQVREIIVGQEEVLDQILIAIFVGGHCLMTGMPGTAKTLMVRTIADALGLEFRRIQFTPDLMPSDITGTDIIDEDIETGHRKWTFVHGPIFGNILLADEINRTPPKTQSALLEAMQERSCTVRGHLYRLPSPFFVLATQNPIELEGTYPLPEAQLDRFLFNAFMGDLSAEDELKVVDLTTATRVTEVKPVTNAEDLLDFQQLVRMVPIAETLSRYVISLVRATRPKSDGRAGFHQEICQLRRQRARRAVHRAGREGTRPLAQALPRDLRGHHVHGYAGAAPSRAAQLSCRVGSHRYRRNFAAVSSRMCRGRGRLMLQRFLDPEVLAGISSLDLLAKTVVDGFVAGLHRSPDFGFSQEFAEYRAYTPGDDLRHVDWNLYARTERCYLKRYRGETNSQLTDSARCQQLHAIHLGPAHEKDGLRALYRCLAFLSRHPQSARRGRTDRLR